MLRRVVSKCRTRTPRARVVAGCRMVRRGGSRVSSCPWTNVGPRYASSFHDSRWRVSLDRTYPHARAAPALRQHSHSTVTKCSESMHVAVVPVLEDNYAYLIMDKANGVAAAVDPADANEVMRLARVNKVRITSILCTHHHDDHAGGNVALRNALGGTVDIVGMDERIKGITRIVEDHDHVKVGDIDVEVLHTPGHTRFHAAFVATSPDPRLDPEMRGLKVTEPGVAVFTGDALFVSGTGQAFEGFPSDMIHSTFYQIGSLPRHTHIFVGHEYTVANLEFATTIEPENGRLQMYMDEMKALRSSKLPTVPTTLYREGVFNPFMRIHHGTFTHHNAFSWFPVNEDVQRNIMQAGTVAPGALWLKLRAMKDYFDAYRAAFDDTKESWEDPIRESEIRDRMKAIVDSANKPPVTLEEFKAAKDQWVADKREIVDYNCLRQAKAKVKGDDVDGVDEDADAEEEDEEEAYADDEDDEDEDDEDYDDEEYDEEDEDEYDEEDEDESDEDDDEDYDEEEDDDYNEEEDDDYGEEEDDDYDEEDEEYDEDEEVEEEQEQEEHKVFEDLDEEESAAKVKEFMDEVTEEQANFLKQLRASRPASARDLRVDWEATKRFLGFEDEVPVSYEDKVVLHRMWEKFYGETPHPLPRADVAGIIDDVEDPISYARVHKPPEPKNIVKYDDEEKFEDAEYDAEYFRGGSY